MNVAELIRVTSSFFSRKPKAPGDCLLVEGVGHMGRTISVEDYQHAGLMSRPPKGTREVVVPIQGGNVLVSVAAKNYQVAISIGEGETTLYSTNADGSTLMAYIALDANGKIKIANSSKSLATILSTILNHLESLTTINCVPGSPVTLSPATIANLEADKANLALLLKE